MRRRRQKTQRQWKPWPTVDQQAAVRHDGLSVTTAGRCIPERYADVANSAIAVSICCSVSLYF